MRITQDGYNGMGLPKTYFALCSFGGKFGGVQVWFEKRLFDCRLVVRLGFPWTFLGCQHQVTILAVQIKNQYHKIPKIYLELFLVRFENKLKTQIIEPHIFDPLETKLRSEHKK